MHTIFSDIATALSLANLVEWNNSEVVHMTRAEVIRSEGVVGISNIVTIGTGDNCWIVFVSHVVDDDRVPGVRSI